MCLRTRFNHFQRKNDKNSKKRIIKYQYLVLLEKTKNRKNEEKKLDKGEKKCAIDTIISKTSYKILKWNWVVFFFHSIT